VRSSSLLACLVVAACQVASKSSAGETRSKAEFTTGEVRLPERSKAPPPTIPPAAYAVDPSELAAFPASASDWPSSPKGSAALLANDARPGTQLLSVTGSVAKKLAPGSLIAGRSYRLTFDAQLLGTGEAKVGIKFREAKNATIRTFAEAITAGPMKHYELEFTAPTYASAAELAVDGRGTSLQLSALSLRMRSALPRTEVVSSWAGSYVPEGYGLVFNDEFNGRELDRQRWFTRFIYGSESLERLNKENQKYADDGNHRVENGVLYLTARRLKLSQPSGVNYESGMIRSDFTARYGFFEARVKMPGGLGVWPAFWLNSDVSESGHLSWPPEIDIFEFVNNGKDDRVDMIHSSTTATPGMKTEFPYVNKNFKTSIRDYVAPFRFNEGFHTIAAEWTPNDVTLYVDGLKVVTSTFQWKYADGGLAGPAHVLLNLAIGDAWAGRYGIDDSAFPQSLAVDWVRVYQKLSPAN